MKCENCGQEMYEEMVRTGFAPEGQLPPERKKYTCKNEQCPKFNSPPILGRTKQEAEDLAKARFAKECPTAIPWKGISPKSKRFARDTWVIEISHDHNDLDKQGHHIFTHAIKDNESDAKGKTTCERGLGKIK